MIRGTTAQFKFEIPYDWVDIKTANVIFWQDGNEGPTATRALPIIKTKTNNDLSWDAINKQVSVTFAPEETARFEDDRKAKIQLTATTNSDIRFASEQQLVTVYPIYGDDSFTDDDVILPSEDGLILLDGGIVSE